MQYFIYWDVLYHLKNQMMITENFPATHTEFYKKFENWRKKMLDENYPQGGVYELIANSKIGRLLKDDVNGILYIGKGEILQYNNRIGKFINSLNSTENVHDVGNRFNMKAIKDKFPLEKAMIKVTLTEDPEQFETNLLQKYYLEYGELPPFNRRLESNSK
jgi:hypothetical protein